MSLFKKKTKVSESADVPETPAEDIDRPLSGYAVVEQRNSFYRDGFRYVVGALLLVTFALFGSLLLNGFQWYSAKDVKRDYFTVDAEGRLTPIIPLNAPFKTREQILNWASEAVTSAYTMDAANYVQRGEEISRYFTTDGFNEYVQAMNTSGTIELIKKETLIATAVPLAVPSVINEGEVNGTYMWRVRVPIRVQYQTQGKGTTQNLMVTVVIQRLPTETTKYGVGISQFVSRPTQNNEIGG